MKRLFSLIIATLLCLPYSPGSQAESRPKSHPLTATLPDYFAAKERTIKRVIFFGDSLTDDGGSNSTYQLLKVLNDQADTAYLQPYIHRFLRDYFQFYEMLCHVVSCSWYENELLDKFVDLTKQLNIPVIPTAPYADGRFSNGLIWAEHLTQMMGLSTQNPEQYVNRSHGGSWSLSTRDKIGNFSDLQGGSLLKVAEQLVSGSLIPPSAELLVKAYIRKYSEFDDDDMVLFFFGGNDYLNMYDDPADVVEAQARSIEKLINHGAQHIVWSNMPDISKAPRYLKMDYPTRDQVQFLISRHNQLLLTTLQNMQKRYEKEGVHIHMLDTRALFWDALNNADSHGLTNTTEPCAKVSLPGMDRSGQRSFQSGGAVETLAKNAAVIALSPVIDKEIMNNPQLVAAFRANEETPQVCSNPDEHAFWDDVHPTQKFHWILGKGICHKLKSVGYACSSDQP